MTHCSVHFRKSLFLDPNHRNVICTCCDSREYSILIDHYLNEMRTDRMSSKSNLRSIYEHEKHLDVRNVHPSAFFNQHMMYESIGKCFGECGIMIV